MKVEFKKSKQQTLPIVCCSVSKELISYQYTIKMSIVKQTSDPFITLVKTYKCTHARILRTIPYNFTTFVNVKLANIHRESDNTSTHKNYSQVFQFQLTLHKRRSLFGLAQRNAISGNNKKFYWYSYSRSSY